MGKKGSLVSVIVPAFNAEAFLEETLRSVAAQTYRELEILIVDDGSADRTLEVAEAFRTREPRARVLRQTNKGVAAARNLGVAEAKGGWIAPLDHDDIWHPAKIAKQVAAAGAAEAAGERPGFVYVWYRRIDMAGRITGSSEPHTVRGPAVNRLAYFNFVGNGSCLLLDREAVRAAGGFDESLHDAGLMGCDDILIQLDIAREHKVEIVPEYLVGYRVMPGQMSGDSERQRRSWRAARDKFRSRGDAASARAWRWGQARRDLLLAENRAWRGVWGGSAIMLGHALLLDPARTGAQLLYRVVRLARRLARPGMARTFPLFAQADTKSEMQGDAHEIEKLARALRAFDAWRLRRLGRADAAWWAGKG